MDHLTDTKHTHIECPHCKNTHTVQTKIHEEVVYPTGLMSSLCGCSQHPGAPLNRIDFVFDGPTGPQGPRLVEVENAQGRSINIGRWMIREDGMHVLRIPLPDQRAMFPMEDVPSFEKHLSADALKVYKSQLDSTVVESLTCVTCGTAPWLPTKQELFIYSGLPSITVRVEEEEEGELIRIVDTDMTVAQIKAMPHFGHTFERKVSLVQFMTQNFAVTLPAVLAIPDVMRREVEMRAEWMAKEFNKGVQNGWLKYGTLMGAHLIPLAMFGPMRKFIMTVFVASDLTMDELNEKFGKRYFVQEGELGPMDVWPQPVHTS